MAQRHGDFLKLERKSVVIITARLVVVGICIVGLFGVVPIAFRQATGTAPCPALGLVPACYVVLLGYALIGASIFSGHGLRTPLFAAGWIPVFGLALTGSSMEVLGYEACPRSADNIPTCFFSLALTIALIVAFFVERFYWPNSKQANGSTSS